MKNIHVLPTDRPSRIANILESNFLQLNYQNDGHRPVYYKNIYITSDEEIIPLNKVNSLSLSDGKDIQTNMSNI